MQPAPRLRQLDERAVEAMEEVLRERRPGAVRLEAVVQVEEDVGVLVGEHKSWTPGGLGLGEGAPVASVVRVVRSSRALVGGDLIDAAILALDGAPVDPLG